MDLARVQLSRYQGRQKQSKNRKLTKSSMKIRQFIFFTQLFGRVQLLKKSLERFDAKASKPLTLIAIRRLAKCFTNFLVK